MSQNNIFNDYSKIQRTLPKRAKGVNLIMYPIVLEAWRRRIKVSFYTVVGNEKTRIFYSLKNDDKEYNFQLSFGGVMEKEARKIVNSKDVTKQYLEQAGVSVPKGKMLNVIDNYKEFFTQASLIGYPVVVKPLNAKNATGVITDIKDSEELEKALATLRDELGYTELMLEQYVKGEDTRVYVIEDKIIAAYMRRPANVIGDGISPIKDLIDGKNEIRKKNPHLKRFMIEVNDKVLNHLNQNGLSLDSIPATGERIFLNESTLHPDGCETVDITDNLSDKIRQLAIDAVKAIPGMRISGLDIMMDSERDEGFVLELNASPNISGHLFPMEGKIRNVPKAFIDYHFPETKDKDTEKYKHFIFDFDNVHKLLRDGTVKELTIPQLPIGDLTAREFIISGNTEGLPFWIHRRALGKLLGGQIFRISNNRLKIKVAGKFDKVESFTDELIHRVDNNIVKIKNDTKWNGVYFYYFKPLSARKTNNKSQKKLRKSITTDAYNKLDTYYKNEIRKLEKNNKKLNSDLNDIKKSSSWRITKPLRTLKNKFKRN